MMVDYAKRQTTKLRLIRELMAGHKVAGTRCDAFTQTEVLAGSSQSPVRSHALAFPSSAPVATAAAPPRVAGSPSPSSSDAETMTDAHDPVLLASLNASFAATGTLPVATAEAQAQVDVQPMSPATMLKYLTPTPALAELLPYDWETAGLVRVFYASQLKEVEAEARRHRWARLRHSARRMAHNLVTNVPLMSVVVGLVLGVTTPVRNLFFDNGYLVMVMDAIALIGNGSIPASLLLLGANLMGSTTGGAADGKGDVRLRDSEQNTEFPLAEDDLRLLGEDGAYARWYNAAHANLDEEEFDLHESFSLQQVLQQYALPPRRPPTSVGTSVQVSGAPRPEAPAAAGAPPEPSGVELALSLTGVSKHFVWGVIVARLILAPFICFVLLVAMIKTMPFLFGGRGTEDKTLLLVLFSEVAAPTAINSSLLFNQREFMYLSVRQRCSSFSTRCAPSLLSWWTYVRPTTISTSMTFLEETLTGA
ncbi:hypothetical protein STCU_06844 [Strigomonas culicis]|uniref:Uncharacterized protein n=1 Tax=Strigomonas culicis TaxID=28005 RepID=S9U2V1_9TRYP|nr:hypothetical protein STCU_06844 [Strigomonas culicis]|eukprot:EPY25097.1 hypothetical protein STCU_06844 [Strigomonas culicis]